MIEATTIGVPKDEEVIFKNVYTKDEAAIRDVYKKQLFTPTTLVKIFAAIDLCIAFMISTTAFRYDEMPIALLGFLVTFVGAFTMLFVPAYLIGTLIACIRFPLLVRKEIKRVRSICGDQFPVITVYFTNSKILIAENSQIVFRFKYQEIKKVFFSKKYAHIRVGRQCFSIAKDGFVEGSAEDFKAFLRAKRDEN